MKAIQKIFILITFIFVTQSVFADNKKETKENETASEKEIFQARLQETEDVLLQEYIDSMGNSEIKYSSEDSIVIYTSEGACVYRGEKSSARDLLNKSAYIFKYDNEEHYVIAE